VRRLPVDNPANRFSESEIVYLEGEDGPSAELEIYFDKSGSVLAKNDSPDLGFDFSVNPYRGCFHGCAYCYARPTHEYLSFGAGTDFERKIVVKRDAPELLRKAFSAKGWRSDLVMFSGVTDCYQPLESRYRLTRGCLEVCAEYNNPARVITKSPLVERDIDVLLRARASVAISIPFSNEAHARALEPWVTTPARRMKTIERLAKAGVPVGVSVAPVIPGLSDEELPDVLAEARAAGATFAGYTLLRLPGHVRDVFESRIREALPEKAERVMSHVLQSRNGKMYDSTFGKRGRGEGPYAEAIGALFEATARRLGYEAGSNVTMAVAPGTARAEDASEAPRRGQLSLFR
jgi:DNA repair photolyase